MVEQLQAIKTELAPMTGWHLFVYEMRDELPDSLHYQTLEMVWNSLSEEERDTYQQRAQNITLGELTIFPQPKKNT
jgi:hypothetical protein